MADDYDEAWQGGGSDFRLPPVPPSVVVRSSPPGSASNPPRCRECQGRAACPECSRRARGWDPTRGGGGACEARVHPERFVGNGAVPALSLPGGEEALRRVYEVAWDPRPQHYNGGAGRFVHLIPDMSHVEKSHEAFPGLWPKERFSAGQVSQKSGGAGFDRDLFLLAILFVVLLVNVMILGEVRAVTRAAAWGPYARPAGMVP